MAEKEKRAKSSEHAVKAARTERAGKMTGTEGMTGTEKKARTENMAGTGRMVGTGNMIGTDRNTEERTKGLTGAIRAINPESTGSLKRAKRAGILAGVLLASAVLAGCGKKNKDYDVYFFNGKSEIAESIQDAARKYEEETGKKVKVFTVGTAEGSETLRAEIKSRDYPTVFATNAIGIEEWKSAGYAMDASGIQNEELKALYESIPDALRLQFEREGNYGIPYNIEGYGLIANRQLLQEILGADSMETFQSDYKSATYEEFQGMLEALDGYIKNGTGSTFSLNGNPYTVREGKTSLTEKLTGVLAIAGAEKWTYGNHYGNYAISTVYETVYDVRESSAERADALREPIIKSLKELEYLTGFAAGPEGAVERGPQFINSTVTGYDQAIQILAEGKAVFIKNGNWIYPNVAKISQETADSLMMLPMKLNFSDEDFAVEGLTIDKMNRSIPEFVSQYYVINAKATEDERREAEDFVLWLNTSETGKDFIINEFAFVPFHADGSVVLDNPLSNDLIRYKEEGNLLANPFDAAPASWGVEYYGRYIMEELFTNPEDWPEERLEEIADACIAGWKSGMEEW